MSYMDENHCHTPTEDQTPTVSAAELRRVADLSATSHAAEVAKEQNRLDKLHAEPGYAEKQARIATEHDAWVAQNRACKIADAKKIIETTDPDSFYHKDALRVLASIK